MRGGDDAHVDLDRASRRRRARSRAPAARAAASPACPAACRRSRPGRGCRRRPARSGPARRASAPVKAPFSWPNSSLSSSSRLIAAQFTATNGRAAPRGCGSWSACATSSLPVPISPRISTVRSVSATLRMRLEHGAHRGPAPDQVAHAELSLDARAQHAVLARELGALERAAHDQADLVVVEGLRDVVLRPELHGLDRDLLAAVRGDHHDRRLGLPLLREAHHIEARRALAEREVGQHEVERAPPELRQGVGAALALGHLVALAAEQSAERQADARFVLDDQDARRAHWPPRSRSRAAG